MFEITPYARGTRFFGFRDPFQAMEEFEKSFFGRQTPAFKTDIRETEQAYILEAELPGFAKEEIRAEIKNGILTVRAEHRSEKEEKDESNRYIRRERSYGSYTRSFDLDGINSDEIAASYENGILSVTLPKEQAKADHGRQLEIH